MPSLSQDELIRTLLAQRVRISAGVWLVVRDVHLAEDVFQEVMVKALGAESAFTNESHLLSWTRVTARNVALNLMRKRGREVTTLSGEIMELLEEEMQAQGGAVAARVEALQACVEALPADSRALVDARYFEGRSCAEIATAFKMGLDATYQRLSRLHRALRECVEGRLNGGSLQSAV
jgi:RNA polymerase sigma-70 factor (ECF subfamily)